MQELFRYFKIRAGRILEEYCRAGDHGSLTECLGGLTEELAAKLLELSWSAYENVLMQRMAENRLLLAYVRKDPGRSDQIREIKGKLTETVMTEGSAFFSEHLPGTLKLIRVAEQQYISSLDEFLARFEKDRDAIGEELFGGRKIHELRSLRIRMGDEHDHGRATALAVTDAGSFIYRPRSIEIDKQMEVLFLRFFPDVCRLPHCLVADGYGYSEYIENIPASDDAEAGEYYRHLGELTAVSLLLRSRDLHLENIIASQTYPVPVDLEMMISPLETGVKMGASPKDINWENTVCGTGFLSYKVEGHEIGVLFSTEPTNRSMPVVDGVRKTVLAYRQDYLEGFARGYHMVLDRKKEICDHIRSMPRTKVRILMRGTQAYMRLRQKMNSAGPVTEAELDSELQRAFTLGFDKLGEKRKSAIVESEKRAILERNVPIFYSYSDDHGLWDAEKLLYDGYFEISCVENLIRTVTGASERELEFELDLLKKAMDRELTEEEQVRQPDHGGAERDTGPELLAVAEALADRIMDDRIDSPMGKPLWFSVNDRYTMSMNYDVGYLGRGDSGIALFFCALAARIEDTDEKQRLLDCCDSIMNDKFRMLERLDSLGIAMAENVISPGLENGLAGLILANEFIEIYGHREYCGRLRELLIRILDKMDLSLSRNGHLNGLAGLVNVLCSFDVLFADPRVRSRIDEMCDILLNRRVEAYDGLLLWPDENDRSVINAGSGRGQCGIGAALHLAGERLGRPDLLKASDDAFAFTDGCYDGEEKLWRPYDLHGRKIPVNTSGMTEGASGILMAMLEAEKGSEARDAERAISICRDSGLYRQDSLVEGNCAVTDILLEAGVRLDRPELIEDARKRMSAVIRRAGDDVGYRYIRPGYGNFFEAGLMYGAAGIGYTCLRCIDPEYFRSIFL